MARTSTYTKTQTYARIELLKSQIRIALRRTTNISLETLKRLEIGIENRWIKKVNVYGLDSKRLIRAKLALEVDWNEHNFQLSIGNAIVSIDERWIDNTAIEVDEVIKLFNEFTNAYSLKIEWQVTFDDWINNNSAKFSEVLKALGLVRANSLSWASTNRGASYQIPEISELSVSCYFVD